MSAHLPEKMKAAVLHAVGDIRCEEVSVPHLGLHDVLVRVRASGVCGSDIPRVFAIGMYHMPAIPGHEFAGEVAALGSGVTHVAVGDRVAVIPLIQCGKCPSCLIGEYSQCDDYDYLGSRSDGGLAEYVKAPASNLVRLPAGLEMEAGAFAEVMSVALHALRRSGGLLGGEKVVVFGAGTVGLLAAQWAKVLGAGAVCSIDVVRSKLDVAKAIGIDLCLNSKESDVAAALDAWTDGRGVHLAIEASGANSALEHAIQSVAKGGKLILVGRQEHPVQLSVTAFEAILRRQLDLLGTWAWSRLPQTEWEVALSFAAKGAIRTSPLVSHRYRIEQAREAFEMMASGKQVYHKVLFVFP